MGTERATIERRERGYHREAREEEEGDHRGKREARMREVRQREREREREKGALCRWTHAVTQGGRSKNAHVSL
jgi:hypothetical protein